MRSYTTTQAMAWNGDTRNVSGWAMVGDTVYDANLISYSYTLRSPYQDAQSGSCTIIIHNEGGQLDPVYSDKFDYGDPIELYGTAGGTGNILLATFMLTDAQVDISGHTLTITGADGIGDLLSQDLPNLLVKRDRVAAMWAYDLLEAYMTPEIYSLNTEYADANMSLAYLLPTYGDSLRMIARCINCGMMVNYEGHIQLRQYDYTTDAALAVYAYQIDTFDGATNALRVDYTYNSTRVDTNIAVRYGQPTIAAIESNYSNTTNDFSGYTPVGDNMRYNTNRVSVNGPVAAATYYSIVGPWVDSDTSFGSVDWQKIYAQYFVDGYYMCGSLPSAADNGRCDVTQYTQQVNRTTKLIKGNVTQQVEEIDMEYIQDPDVASSMRAMLAVRRNKKIQQVHVDYRFNPFLEMLDRVRVYTYDYPTTGLNGQIMEMTCNYSGGSFNGSLVLEDII